MKVNEQRLSMLCHLMNMVENLFPEADLCSIVVSGPGPTNDERDVAVYHALSDKLGSAITPAAVFASCSKYMDTLASAGKSHVEQMEKAEKSGTGADA